MTTQSHLIFVRLYLCQAEDFSVYIKVLKSQVGGIQTTDTIFLKSIELLAYADDIDIMGRSQNDVKKAFIALYHSCLLYTSVHSNEKAYIA